MKVSFLVVAGGTGARMHSATPKQFLLLASRPILMHTLEACHRAVPEADISLVLPEQEIKSWETLCKEYSFPIRHQVVPGGSTRFASVKNGLQSIRTQGLVAIHDGVRPFISIEMMQRLVRLAINKGSAVPCCRINESLRHHSGKEHHVVDRKSFVTIQTPQVFRIEEIRQAYLQPYRSTFTDDASVAESIGIKVHLAEGDRLNIKITHPEDLLIAEALLKR